MLDGVNVLLSAGPTHTGNHGGRRGAVSIILIDILAARAYGAPRVRQSVWTGFANLIDEHAYAIKGHSLICHNHNLPNNRHRYRVLSLPCGNTL